METEQKNQKRQYDVTVVRMRPMCHDDTATIRITADSVEEAQELASKQAEAYIDSIEWKEDAVGVQEGEEGIEAVDATLVLTDEEKVEREALKIKALAVCITDLIHGGGYAMTVADDGEVVLARKK